MHDNVFELIRSQSASACKLTFGFGCCCRHGAFVLVNAFASGPTADQTRIADATAPRIAAQRADRRIVVVCAGQLAFPGHPAHGPVFAVFAMMISNQIKLLWFSNLPNQKKKKESGPGPGPGPRVVSAIFYRYEFVFYI